MDTITIPDGAPICCCGTTPPPPPTGCGCSAISSRDTLVCTIESDDCAALDGLTWNLPWSGGQWIAGIPDALGACINGGVSVQCDEEAENSDWRDYEIQQTLQVSGCETTPTDRTPADSGACDTFELRLECEMTESSPGVCPCGCESYPAAFTVVITLKP